MAEIVRTKPNRPWVLKMGLFLLVLVAMGSWFLYDATVAYPKRGWNDVSYRLWVYLDTSDEAMRLTMRDLSLDDPKAAFERLKERRGEQQLGAVEAARYEWLRALYAVGALDAETTEALLVDDPRTPQVTDGPQSRLDELAAIWEGPNARTTPAPLASWDIAVQWIIAIACFAGVALLLIHILRTVRVRYGWDPEAKRLYLPDGSTIVAEDLEDVDKRLWHKFIVFLKIKDGHEKHAGEELKLDLYQHAMLEGWVLELERTAFPDRAEEEKSEAVEATVESAAAESKADESQ